MSTLLSSKGRRKSLSRSHDDESGSGGVLLQNASASTGGMKLSETLVTATRTVDDWARKYWSFLHEFGANYPVFPSPEQRKDAVTFLELFGKFLPCHDCAKHFKEMVQRIPFEALQSRVPFSRWIWQTHNSVNTRLGKKTYPWEKYVKEYNLDAVVKSKAFMAQFKEDGDQDTAMFRAPLWAKPMEVTTPKSVPCGSSQNWSWLLKKSSSLQRKSVVEVAMIKSLTPPAKISVLQKLKIVS